MGDRGPVVALGLLLLVCFLLGGSARDDVQSLILLRPTVILLLGYGVWGLTRKQLEDNLQLFLVAAAILVLTALHLVPLPPALWTQIPGRKLVEEIDRAAGLGAVWRPVSLAPRATWNALYALAAPLAALVLAARLDHDRRIALIPWLIVAGLVSALLALLQIIGPVDGPFYFYHITNSGAAVGLFANRNHQAIFLATMFPLLAAFVALGRTPLASLERRAAVAIAVGAFLVPLVFITGSRAGLLLAAIGVICGTIIYRLASRVKPRLRPSSAAHGRGRRSVGSRLSEGLRSRRIATALVAVVVLGLGVVTIIFGRAEALDRLLSQEGRDATRFAGWPVVVDMVVKYFPTGSGIGSFATVFKVEEPTELLEPTYLNHAHNDFLELAATAGLPGLLILMYVVALVIVRVTQILRGRKQKSEALTLAALGLVVVVMLALASIGDYPLRTPSLAVLFAIAAVLAATPVVQPRPGG